MHPWSQNLAFSAMTDRADRSERSPLRNEPTNVWVCRASGVGRYTRACAGKKINSHKVISAMGDRQPSVF